MRKTLNLLILSCAIPAVYAHAGDWPHARGPRYDANAPRSEEISLPKGKIPFVWKKRLGQGYSGVIIVKNRLYTQYQDRGGQYVASLSAETGEELWKTRYGWPWEIKGSYPGTYATPTWSDGKIYFTGCYGTVGCLNAETGALLWSFDLTKRYDTSVPSFGYACTPLVLAGKVYITLGGNGAAVAALDSNTGDTVWKSGNAPASYSSPLPVSVDGEFQIITALRNYLSAFDPETGKELWRHKLSEGYDEHASWPIFHNNDVFLTSPFGRGAAALRISGNYSGKSRIETLWEEKHLSTDIFSPLFANGYIFGYFITEHQANPDGDTEGEFKCVDPNTGKTLWSSDKTGHVNLIACGDKLILFSESGTLIVIEASPDGYKELWRGVIFRDARCWTLPSISDGRLFLRGGNTLIRVALDDGTPTRQTVLQRDTGVFSLKRIIDDFLSEYDTGSFVKPTVGLFAVWFVAAILIFAISAVLAKTASASFEQFNMFFTLHSSLLSLIGTFVFSKIAGRFVFTLPTLVFLGLILICPRRRASAENSDGSKWIPRLHLLGFAGLCVIYYYCCDSFFIVSGIAFLAGLIPATPICLLLASKLQKQEKLSCTAAALFLAAYSLFFWSSALLVILKNKV
ncbi:MAG: PQQ-binding-like beta-propeller repeat protein [Kiritimatiellaeota bacterium]|nr:PQQ-binding-like beta-propeller repeat protein [Kiritimatiellota bacterium]